MGSDDGVVANASNTVNRELSNAGNSVNATLERNKDTLTDVFTLGASYVYREAYKELVEKPQKAARAKAKAESDAADQAIAAAREEDTKKDLLTERDKKRAAQRVRGGTRSRSTVMTSTPDTKLGQTGGKTILGV